MKKALNLYAGLGGNRKYWNGVKITAVEKDKSISAIYKDLYPDDEVIIGDAHDFLLKHYFEYDFIWSSPPCQKHSRLNLLNVSKGIYKPGYVDMRLYQEIILLRTFFNGKYCIENVISYYKPLLNPFLSGNHYFWSNFPIKNVKPNRVKISGMGKKTISTKTILQGHGIEIKNWHGFTGRKDQAACNCVEPELGLYIFSLAMNLFDEQKHNLFSEVV